MAYYILIIIDYAKSDICIKKFYLNRQIQKQFWLHASEKGPHVEKLILSVSSGRRYKIEHSLILVILMGIKLMFR